MAEELHRAAARSVRNVRIPVQGWVWFPWPETESSESWISLMGARSRDLYDPVVSAPSGRAALDDHMSQVHIEPSSASVLCGCCVTLALRELSVVMRPVHVGKWISVGARWERVTVVGQQVVHV